jgi:NitT/TauT family transport system ATP-binding protein
MEAAVAAGCAIHVDDVSKSFGRDADARQVLDGVSLAVAPGEIVSIIGRSGAGKSTFLRLVCGLMDADSGTVTIAGESPHVAREAKRIGFLPQSPALLPWLTVRRNVSLVQRVNARHGEADDAAELLAEVGLGDVLDAYPAELSGGMQHRVALARALATGAQLLALDEPFGSLDEITRASLYDLLIKEWRQRARTIVLVTHNLDEAVLLSDRIVVLSGSPARVAGVVEVSGERPRQQALDAGAHADVLARTRTLLEGAS